MPTILMLEDDSDDRYITSCYLQEFSPDIKIEYVERSEEVMEYLFQRQHHSENLPDIILLDKNVPVRSGIEILKELKSHKDFSIIPVIMVSGSALPHEVVECYRLGVSTFIEKPANDKLTGEKINTFLKYWFEVAELPKAGIKTLV